MAYDGMLVYEDPFTGKTSDWIYFPDAVDEGSAEKVAIAPPRALRNPLPWRRNDALRIVVFGNGSLKVFKESELPQDINSQLNTPQ